MGKFEVHIENEFPFSGCAKCKFMDAQISKTDLYSNDDTFTWDYIMEQKAKLDWNETHPLENNPYDDLPKLNILTYN